MNYNNSIEKNSKNLSSAKDGTSNRESGKLINHPYDGAKVPTIKSYG
jgi:hypothetical protein